MLLGEIPQMWNISCLFVTRCAQKKTAISNISIFMDINGIQPCNAESLYWGVVIFIVNSTGFKDAKAFQSSRECTEHTCGSFSVVQSSWGDPEPHREGSDVSPRPDHRAGRITRGPPALKYSICIYTHPSHLFQACMSLPFQLISVLKHRKGLEGLD